MVRDRKLGSARLLAMLKTDPDVETAEPNYLRRVSVITPNDTDFPKLWGLRNTGQTVNLTSGTSGVDSNFLPAWKMARPAPGEIVVGVVDTGVDVSHPDLAPNIWTHPGEIPGNGIDDDSNGYVDDIHGYDFILNTAAMTDSGFHGTHVAGTIAAAGKNQAGVIGVQYQSKILPLKVSTDGDTISLSAILDAFDYAIHLKQSGVNIVALNASYGGPDSSVIGQNAIEQLRIAGIVLCAAAGNDAANNDTTAVYPASYANTNIISVAAITQTNGLAGFSNFGSTSVDIAAPGSNIFSALPLSEVPFTNRITAGATTFAATYIEYSGTTPITGLTGSIHDCGIGNPGQFPPAVAGNIALIQRGTITFALKVTNAMNAGAAAAIVYDNTADSLTTGNWTFQTPGAWIPSLKVTRATGQALLAQLPSTGTVVHAKDPAAAYQFLNGTSMAAPHVTGAVAFAARNFPSETVAQRVARILNHVTPVPALAGKTATGGRLDLLRTVDTDGDQLPDWWELEYFANLAQNAAGDTDADGFAHLDEFLAATHPKNPASHLAFMSSAPAPAGDHFVLAFPSVEDRLYQIQWSNSLENASWQPLGAPVAGTGAILQVQDANVLAGFPRRFYRMTLLPD